MQKRTIKAGLVAAVVLTGLVVSPHRLMPDALAQGPAADPAIERKTIEKVMLDYFEAFSRGDMAAAMTFMNLPLMSPSPHGFAAYTTADEASAAYTKIRDTLGRQGYAKSEWTDLHVKLLGPAYAIAEGVYVRYKADGGELGRSGGTYLLNKVDGAWKIAVVTRYRPSDVPKLD